MAIWLSRPRDAHHQPDDVTLRARLGAAGDVLPRELFGSLVSLDDAYAALADDRAALIEAARNEALGIVEAGHAEAEAILAAARRERDEAARQGYRDGYDRALGDWMDRLADVANAQNQLQVRMRERLADIVASAVEQIVRTENREALFERALASVERIVDGATYLRVAVHPDDLDSAKDTFDRLATRWRELGRPIPMSVVGDKRLAPGSCVCESDFGAVDASLDTQLRAMHGAVSRALKRTLVEAEQDMAQDAADAEAAQGEMAASYAQEAELAAHEAYPVAPPAARDPYATQDPYAVQDPYAAAPHDPYAHPDPYAAQPAHDPYAEADAAQADAATQYAAHPDEAAAHDANPAAEPQQAEYAAETAPAPAPELTVNLRHGGSR